MSQHLNVYVPERYHECSPANAFGICVEIPFEAFENSARHRGSISNQQKTPGGLGALEEKLAPSDRLEGCPDSMYPAQASDHLYPIRAHGRVFHHLALRRYRAERFALVEGGALPGQEAKDHLHPLEKLATSILAAGVQLAAVAAKPAHCRRLLFA